ncbi:MAG TPA: hypothetical protein VNL91_02075 [Thermoanaerobaculia bacterium]|nr:hypothetical protein [Thermoanaerobaculia bacterium]
MRSSSVPFAAVVAAAFLAAAAEGARIDMDDPRRAVGRESDIRVDAQLLQETLSPGARISVHCRIDNQSARAVAVAAKVTALSYDIDTQTIHLSIGAEIPSGGAMPQLIVIPPGESKTFAAGGTVSVPVSDVRSPFARTPRFVQIRVNVLRDAAPFAQLIGASTAVAPPRLSDAHFEMWLAANESIFLNALPVRWVARGGSGVASAEDRMPSSW